MADFPSAVPLLPALPAYSQQDVLDLFDRILPDHYLAPLKDPGPGYEYLQAVALMISRVSQAIASMGTGAYIGSGSQGSVARVTVELTRPSDIFGPVTLQGRFSVPQGTLVGTADGYLYQLAADVTFGAGDLGPHEVVAIAVARGETWNRPGPFTTADGELVPGPVNRMVRPVVPIPEVGQPNFDPTIKVRQVSAATGGKSPTLDGVGNDRGLPRNFSGITSVQLSAPYAGAVLVGAVVSTADGFRYRTTARVDFADAGTRTVPVEPLFLGPESNLDPLAYGYDPAVPVQGQPVVTVVSTPAGSLDAGVLSVTSPTPVSESDNDYRTRLAILPKTVTPDAMRAALYALLGNVLALTGKSYGWREAWDVRLNMAYDAPWSIGTVDTLDTANLNAPCPPFNGAVMVYDYDADRGNADALSNRYLSANPERGLVVIRLPLLSPSQGALYPQVVELLEAIKPAGIALAFINAD